MKYYLNTLKNLVFGFQLEFRLNNGFDNTNYRDTVEVIQLEIVLFNVWAKLANEAKNHEDQEVQNLGQQLEKKVLQLQTREFPLMRKAYANIINKKLWEQDIEVKAYGNSSSTIEFTGGIFAANKNVKDAHVLMLDMLHMLRFDRANYKWYKYDSNYTYFDLKSKRDNEPVEIK